MRIVLYLAIMIFINSFLSIVCSEIPQLTKAKKEKPKIKLKMTSRELSPFENLLRQMEAKGNQYELPKTIWYPIMMTECEGNPRCVYITKNEKSYGVFQINAIAHPKLNTKKALDVNYNCDWQMPVLKEQYLKGKAKGLNGVELTKYVAKHGQRPEWTQWYKDSLEKYYKELEMK